MMRRLNSRHASFEADFAALIDGDVAQSASVDARAAAIVDGVAAGGNAALIDYTRELDRWPDADIATIEVSCDAQRAALARLSDDERTALEAAAERLTAFARRQKLDDVVYTDEWGNRLGHVIRPLDRVGVYVPGGKAAYPSSVLMNTLPARVAGVGDITLVSPAPGGQVNDWVLAAAALSGVDRFLCIGGAQAIGALAAGTETIAAVDKIVGPGNAYVAAAKRHVFGQVGIESIAGPSEVLIVADGSGDPAWAALDLFAQAEHDEMARATLISPDAAYLDAVAGAIDEHIDEQPRREIIRAALAGQGALIQVADLDEAFALSNRMAPEHLELAIAEGWSWLDHVRHAGAVFVGHATPEAFGDYCAGPNHVLPTGASARFCSALGVYDFQKRISVVAASHEGARRLAPIADVLARAEGLDAHSASAMARATALSSGDSR